MKHSVRRNFFVCNNTDKIIIASGWVPIKADEKIDYDLEKSPVRIKTNTVAGSNREIKMSFYDLTGDNAGQVDLHFASTIKYHILYCNEKSDFDIEKLPTTTNKLWKVTKTTEPRIRIHCNGVLVVDILMSSSTCSDSEWSKTWTKDVTQIEFSFVGSVSAFYVGVSPGNK